MFLIGPGPPSLLSANSGRRFRRNRNFPLPSRASGLGAFLARQNSNDPLNRLLQATSGAGGYGKLVWTYDPVGNRLTQTAKGVKTTYGYMKGSNRLASLTTGKAKQAVGTTAAGNINSFSPAMNSVNALSYNQANRLAAVTTGTTAAATYTYDAFGQRLVKTPLGGSPILYQFDRGGNLLEEGYGSTTGPVDYIYLGTQPVATLTLATGAFSYLHTDHLGTPQLATGSTQAVVWSAAGYQPFGTTGTVTGTITQNLRFPGQYYDADSSFYHNGFRDYMPNLGRYLEFDPVGLGGGLNAYGYTKANPLKYIDHSGQNPLAIAAGIAFLGGAVIGALASEPGHRWEGAAAGGIAAAATVYYAPAVAVAFAETLGGESIAGQIAAGTVGASATVANGTAAGTAAVNYFSGRNWDLGLSSSEKYALIAGLVSLDLPATGAAFVMTEVMESDIAFSSILASALGTTAGVIDNVVAGFHVDCPR